MWRSVFLGLSTNRLSHRVATRSGIARRIAARFVTGETPLDALVVCRRLNRRGATAEIHYLGESVTDLRQLEATTCAYLDLLSVIAQSGVDSHISVKPSQLGQQIGDQLCYQNVDRLAMAAGEYGNFVWIDMEGSGYTERTVRMYEKLRARHENLGLALQAYLRRCRQDVKELVAAGGTIRLCKGAYSEPPELAFPRKSDVDENYRLLAEALLCSGLYQAFATHDERMIQHIVNFAKGHNIGSDRYEFQMLYGVRRDLQEKLMRDGYRIRVYVPYGGQWYPYFMRRLAERPANLVSILRSLLQEQRGPRTG